MILEWSSNVNWVVSGKWTHFSYDVFGKDCSLLLLSLKFLKSLCKYIFLPLRDMQPYIWKGDQSHNMLQKCFPKNSDFLFTSTENKYIVLLTPKKRDLSFDTALTFKSSKVLTRTAGRNTCKTSFSQQKTHTDIPIVAFVVDPDGSETEAAGIPEDYF